MGTTANPIETTPDLGRTLVEQLVKARATAFHLEVQFKERLDAFLAANADLVSARDDAAKLASQKELELRGFAVARYVSSGDKHPAPGIGIRITTAAEILDEAAAIAWAKVSGVGLTLDERAIKKVALSSPGALPFVRISETPSATVAQDLAAALTAEVAA